MPCSINRIMIITAILTRKISNQNTKLSIQLKVQVLAIDLLNPFHLFKYPLSVGNGQESGLWAK